MKLILLLAVVVSVAFTVPQFFYYSDIRKAIAIRNDQSGYVVIKNYSGNKVMVADYLANSSVWISVSRLAPGRYTATTNITTINFYRRP